MRRAPLIAFLFAGIAVGAVAGSERPRSVDTYEQLALYSEAMSMVHDRYVDALPWAKLVNGGIKGMVQSLDADSALLGPPPQHPEVGATTPTADGDVGIVLARRNGELVVIAARDGTPARMAGLRSGDYILSIDGLTTESMLPMGAAARLRGRPGTQVVLQVARTGWPEPRPLTLTRAKPPAGRVSEQVLGDGILYVRIPELGDGTARELRQLLDVAPAERAAGLVLDLRNTPGGDVPAAVAVAGMFLDPGSVVARVQSRVPDQSRELLAPAAAGRHDQPMAVLVNHGTESAAEVLAGALQDSRRAAVVGSTSFGDASAQSMIPLPDGQALSLTTARYLTPKGRAISGKGIVPDVVATAAPAPADLEPAATTAKVGRADPEVELAFDLVKAARLLDHAPPPATPAEQTGAAVRWRGAPTA